MSEQAAAPAANPAPQSNQQSSVDSSPEVSESQELSVEETHGHVSEESIDSDPSLSKQEKKEAKKALKELKLKFNGKEYVEKLPFEIPAEAEEYMRRQLQMAKMAHVNAQDRSNLEREVQAFFQELRKNPKKALSNPEIGVDIKRLAAEILEEEIANSQKSPEQLEREKLESELKALKEEREREKEERDAREREALLEREYERYDKLMSDALDSFQIPKTPYAVKKMAEYMAISVKNQIEPDMEIIANQVVEEMEGDLREAIHSMPVDKLEKFLGDEILNKLRKNRVAKAKQAPPVPVKSAVKDVAQSPKPEEKQKNPVTIKNFFGI